MAFTCATCHTWQPTPAPCRECDDRETTELAHQADMAVLRLGDLLTQRDGGDFALCESQWSLATCREQLTRFGRQANAALAGETDAEGRAIIARRRDQLRWEYRRVAELEAAGPVKGSQRRYGKTPSVLGPPPQNGADRGRANYGPLCWGTIPERW